MARKLKANRWKQKHDLLLRKMLKRNFTVDEIAEELGRTRAAVLTRKYTLGIKKRAHNPNIGRPSTKATTTDNQPAVEAQTVTNQSLNQIFKAAKANGMTVNITIK